MTLSPRSRLPRTATVLGITLLASVIVISRRVDAFTNAQFYAEDGAKWFANAYTYGPVAPVPPVAFLLSSRFDTVVPSFRARLAVCAVYVLMPSTELNVDITTAQFHLVVLAFLVIVADRKGLV